MKPNLKYLLMYSIIILFPSHFVSCVVSDFTLKNQKRLNYDHKILLELQSMNEYEPLCTYDGNKQEAPFW